MSVCLYKLVLHSDRLMGGRGFPLLIFLGLFNFVIFVYFVKQHVDKVTLNWLEVIIIIAGFVILEVFGLFIN